MAETATLSAMSMEDGIVSQDKTMTTTRSNFSIATILGMEGRAESLPSSPVLPSLTMNFDPATIVPLSSPLCSNNSPRCSITTSAPSLLPVDVVSSNNYVANWSRRHLPLGDFSERFFHWKDNDNEDDEENDEDDDDDDDIVEEDDGETIPMMEHRYISLNHAQKDHLRIISGPQSSVWPPEENEIRRRRRCLGTEPHHPRPPPPPPLLLYSRQTGSRGSPALSNSQV